jgi:predicted ribosome quality control (RQC) complex YloA/Tae2 family protein
MPCDAMTYSFVCKELAVLVGGRIDKITMPERDELFLFVRSQSANHKLVISAGTYPRIHLTTEKKDNPLTPPAFCMNLRKNIAGGRILSVSQEKDERIIYIDIAFKNELGDEENKRLICEIMGKYSNIILTHENGKIIECVKHISLDGSKRAVFPGLIYSVPKQDKLSPLCEQGILQLGINKDNAFEKLKENVMGLSGASFSEAIFLAEQDEKSKFYPQKIANGLSLLYSLPALPCVIDSEKCGEAKSDFFVRPYASLKAEYRFFDSLSAAMDYFYSDKDRVSRIAAKSRNLLGLVKNAKKRAEKRIADFYFRIKENENSEKDRIKGEVLLANIFRVKAGDSSIDAENFYDENKVISIELDPTLSAADNAQKYFKKYSKKKRTIDATRLQIEKTEAELACYKELIYELENITKTEELADIADEMSELRLLKPQKRDKHEKKSKPRLIEFEGFKIFVGKNNLQNEKLFRESKKTDFWLHIKDFHGSHVIISAESRQVPVSVIERAASLAAFYSEARQADKCEVVCCQIKNVSKPSGFGMGKVVYKNEKTLIVSPLGE